MNCEEENQQADRLLEQDTSPLSSRALQLGNDENFSTNSHTEIPPRKVHLLSYLQKTAEKVVYAGNHQTEFQYSQYSLCFSSVYPSDVAPAPETAMEMLQLN